MKTISFFSVLGISLLLLGACTQTKSQFDASGAFEAEEFIIAAEAAGAILELNIEEGQELKQKQLVGYIDTTQLYLRKLQFQAQMQAVGSRVPNIALQTSYFDQQLEVTRVKLNNLLAERERFKKLVAGDAATPKQLDDIEVQIVEARKQMDLVIQQKRAQSSILQTQQAGFVSDKLPLQTQIEQINDQIAKSLIINPIKGTVLSKYAKENEVANNGKALYKIADLSEMILRVYISGNQLPQIKLNQKVKVFTDDGKGGFKEQEGIVTWISSKAEFTPKTIQTKDKRANMVYAVKIKVVNDGTYKIGMYGEIKF